MLLSRRFIRVYHPQRFSTLFSSSFLSPKDFLEANNNPNQPNPLKTNNLKDDIPSCDIKLGVFLSKYGVNISKLASEGKLEAVIGRDEEIKQAIQILSRRRKNNPCLIGEPGVGKTSIAEGLANLIHQGKVPSSMKDKVIISLDLPSMIAGAKFRGEFEDRLKGVIKEIEQAGNRIILFIDEIHLIVGAGKSEGAMDASNILKPSLARGGIKCLGTTTTDEYSRYIEKDAALARRFQSIYINEPSEEDTKKILYGLREKYEMHHKIEISDEAILAAVALSAKYLTSKHFPDKAIDLIDEACSKLKNKLESQPLEIQVIEKNIQETQSKMDKDLEDGSSQSLKDELKLHKLQDQFKLLNEQWKERNKTLDDIFELKQQIKSLQKDIQFSRSSNNNDTNIGRIQELSKIISSNNNLIKDYYSSLNRHLEKVSEQSQDRIKLVSEFRNSLKPEDIAEIISKSTGIPMNGILGNEDKNSLLNMEQELKDIVINQDEAISIIAKCIRLSRAGLRFHDRPMGVFLMLGPTGVGKTELAKALCSTLFKGQSIKSSFLRIDMSEYMEKFSVSRLIGAPPGYVGYEDGGVLTDAVRRRPYQLILLDEFEKAHREVSNLLLQVFDEGRLTDSQGREVDFRNTVIIMTSNLGADILRKYHPESKEEMDNLDEKGSSDPSDPLEKEEENKLEFAIKDLLEKNKKKIEEKHKIAQQLVHNHFSPEFVNRLDDVIVFNPLNKEAVCKICEIQFLKVAQLLQEKGITLHISNTLMKAIVEDCDYITYGARPLKRKIQNNVMSPLAVYILEGSIKKGDKVFLSTTGKALTYFQEVSRDTFISPVILTSRFVDSNLGIELAVQSE